MKKLEESQTIARKVLPLLSERSIPITPTNYRLWYEYFAGSHPELQKELDRLMEKGDEITEETTQALYKRFFSMEALGRESKLVEQAGERVRLMVVSVVKEILISIAQTNQYGNSLNSYIEKIDKAQDLSDIQELVKSLLDETESVRQGQQKFQMQMEQASKELDKVHRELKRREEMALTDELTGLPNRRGFNSHLVDEVRRQQRYNIPVSLIMVDLDDFKTVNDSHGHLVGDKLLVAVARAIQLSVRETDKPSRYGGEEFTVVCPHTELEGAKVIAERLRRLIDNTDFKVKDQIIKATVSAGIACYHSPETTDELVERADQALYLAKQKGKNRVCSEEDL